MASYLYHMAIGHFWGAAALGRVAAVSGLAGTLAAPAALAVLPGMVVVGVAARRLWTLTWISGLTAAAAAGLLVLVAWHDGWPGATGAALWAGSSYPVAATAGRAFGSGRPVAATVLGNAATFARLAALPLAAVVFPGSAGGLLALAFGGLVAAMVACALAGRTPPGRGGMRTALPASALTSLFFAVWMTSDVPIASRLLAPGQATLWAVLASTAKAPGWLTGPAWNAAAGRQSTRLGWAACAAGLAIGCPVLLAAGPLLTGFAGATLPGWQAAAVGVGALAGTAAYGMAAMAARTGRHAWAGLALAPVFFAGALRPLPDGAPLAYAGAGTVALIVTLLLARGGRYREAGADTPL